MSVDGEFKRLMADDRLCTDVLKAVRDGDAEALRRLGLGGFAQYAGRLSELMTDSVRDGLDFSPDFAALMQQVNSPVRYAHHLVNECGTAVQTALDERQGLRLRVVQPEYNDGRTKGLIGDALSRDTPEQGKEALATGLGTAVKDAGNEFMKQNAEQRSRAGFTVTVERSGGVNCCPWCADRVGRWELKNAPKDVFGCHDNCKCMVDYTNSRGVRSQRLGRSRFVEVGYQPHVNLTKDLEKNKPVRLTKSPNLEKPKRLTISIRYQDDVDIGRIKNSISGNNYLNTLKDFYENLRNLKNKQVSAILERTYDKTTFQKSVGKNRKRSYFLEGEGSVYLSNSASTSTIAHELFHKVDNDNSLSKNGSFDKCISDDYDRLRKIAENAGQTISDMLYLKYPTAFAEKGRLKPEYRGISDIIDGMTNGQTWLGFGHSKSDKNYWGKPKALQKETFAQYGRIVYEQNEEVFSMFTELFPETSKQITDVLGVVYLFGE